MTRFDEWWEVLPGTRRVGKKPCKEKWQQKKLDEQAEVIISWTRKMAKTKSWRDGFNPMPATIINQERWLDGVPEEVTKRDKFIPQNFTLRPNDILNYIIKNKKLTLNQIASQWKWISNENQVILGVLIPDDPETGADGFRFMADECVGEGV